MGVLSHLQAERTLVVLARVMDALLADANIAPEDHWQGFTDLVAKAVAESTQATEIAVAALVAAGQTRFQERFGHLGNEERELVFLALQPGIPPNTYDTAYAICPACGQEGTLIGSDEPHWDVDVDVEDGQIIGGGWYVDYVTLTPTEFDCWACGLVLDFEQLEVAGLGEPVVTEDIAFSAYDQRDYFGDDEPY
jgi:hypothetical protein